MKCLKDNECIVVTPDRDIETTVLAAGEVYKEVLRVKGSTLPRGVKEKDTYLPKHSYEGPISADEMRRLVSIAEKQHQVTHARRRQTGKLDQTGGNNPFPASTAAPEEAQEVDGDSEWICVYRSGPGALGDSLQPPADGTSQVVNGKEFKLFSLQGEEFLVRKVAHSDIARFQSLMAKGIQEAPEAERDVRVLPVMFDSAEERFRTCAEAVPEYDEVDYEDFPLAGPRTVYHDVKQLRRMGLDYLLHHEAWLKKSGVRTTDRSVHEHSAICRALHYMMTYDQLNLPALAAAEAMNRRRALIEHAHAGRPDAPSYEAAEEFLGVRDSADGSLVDPALTQHAARRQAAKAEVLKQTRLAAEERKNARKGDPKPEKGGGKGAKEAPSNP